jgi:TonB family protein
MSYAQFGLIQASDFNTLVGGNPTTTSGTLNAVWATGGTTAGYGQTAIANVAVAQTVGSAEWSNLVNKTANSASHQGTSITAVTAPASGGTVTYLSAIPTNLTTIFNSKLNAASQGATTANTATYASTWSAGLTFTHTVSFANGDAARYFFNSGGQLKLTCSNPNSTAGINLLFNNLASNVGTVVMSAPSSGTVSISSTSYNGITKVGGGGNAPPGWTDKVIKKVKPLIVFNAESVSGNPAAVIQVSLAPDGAILSTSVLTSSGNSSWDRAVLLALSRAESLPKDDNGKIPQREVKLTFKPKD